MDADAIRNLDLRAGFAMLVKSLWRSRVSMSNPISDSVPYWRAKRARERVQVLSMRYGDELEVHIA